MEKFAYTSEVSKRPSGIPITRQHHLDQPMASSAITRNTALKHAIHYTNLYLPVFSGTIHFSDATVDTIRNLKNFRELPMGVERLQANATLASPTHTTNCICSDRASAALLPHLLSDAIEPVGRRGEKIRDSRDSFGVFGDFFDELRSNGYQHTMRAQVRVHN